MTEQVEQTIAELRTIHDPLAKKSADLLAAMWRVVQAATEIESQFRGLNGTLTIGHPLWTDMQRRLADLNTLLTDKQGGSGA